MCPDARIAIAGWAVDHVSQSAAGGVEVKIDDIVYILVSSEANVRTSPKPTASDIPRQSDYVFELNVK